MLHVAAADWPQFRGPGGQGHADATNLPLSFSTSENVAWTTELPGTGWSSPVALDGQDAGAVGEATGELWAAASGMA